MEDPRRLERSIRELDAPGTAVEILEAKVEAYLARAPRSAEPVEVPMDNEPMGVRGAVISKYEHLTWLVEDIGGPPGKRCLRFS